MENFYQNIERYLLGELAENDLTAFENALQSDAALANSVAQHREMMLRLDALRLRNKVKSATVSMQATPVASYGNRVFWTIAAFLMLLIAAIWHFNRPDETSSEKLESQPQTAQPDTLQTPPNETPTPIADKPKEIAKETKPLIALAREFQERPTQTFVRDATQQAGDPSPKTPFQQAAEAFYIQDYRLAANLLKDDKLVQEDEGARFIRASARFNIGQFAASANDFDVLKDSFQFKHEARWNFLMCQIALGNMEIAKSLLAKMVEEEDFPFRSKAVEFVKSLQSH